MITAALVLCALLMAGWMVFVVVGAHRLQWHIWQIALALVWLLAAAMVVPISVAVG